MSIIILIILASITTNIVLKDGGIIKKAIDGKYFYERQADKESEDINKLAKELEEYIKGQNQEDQTGWIERNVKININVTSYNETLGEFPIVCNIVGKSNDKVVYEEAVELTVKDAGMNSYEFKIKLPKDVDVTVTDEYHSPNYDLTSDSTVKRTISQDNINVEFQFDYEYNYKMIS